ncbi:keratin-associated protein 29-1 [Erinaceus europaeus]|uniref:Keratin-associated protein 29-1 n=1 Tax=Erinaceus europaeus TaxID=9365 RepID=A0ABM3YBF7_ERIEU|nr:keratin-associated protein 29-1 [Erinaceus europaeus]
MADVCCPGSSMAVPAVSTMSICSTGGSSRRGLCLPSFCRSRTWQLVTCAENHQSSDSTSSGYESASCQPTCLPATSCVGFVCQPIHSCKASCDSGSGQSTCLVSSNSCQPSTCVFSCCSPTCYVSSPCQSLHCQRAPPLSFICHPVASCQPSCSIVNSCKPTSCGSICSGQPTCGGSASCNQSGCKSPSCPPACCVTGCGKSSSGGCNCFQPNSPSVCKANTDLPTSCHPSHESGFCKEKALKECSSCLL